MKAVTAFSSAAASGVRRRRRRRASRGARRPIEHSTIDCMRFIPVRT
ncbi:MAG TPA: hypothetical protein VKE51_17845 [Vicinamibacterales bacterium]|nr:hypothetical protein [Vicinamibacterales bacterium]